MTTTDKDVRDTIDYLIAQGESQLRAMRRRAQVIYNHSFPPTKIAASVKWACQYLGTEVALAELYRKREAYRATPRDGEIRSFDGNPGKTAGLFGVTTGQGAGGADST